jgi:anaerobic selenocysteine-containing dehydrogenase
VTYWEMPTGIMADEILVPGPGQIRAFICHGGNVAVIVPDQRKIVYAFDTLELSVAIDSFMTPTAKLAHYVLPTRLMYERPDLPCWQAESVYYSSKPYARYTRAVAKPPLGSQIVDDVEIFWGLAKRLGIKMTSLGVPLAMDSCPAADDLLAIAAGNAPFSFDDLRQSPLGGFYPGEAQFAEAGDPGSKDKFTVCPPDVADEMRALASEDFSMHEIVVNGTRATHRLAVRRHRYTFNSNGRALPSSKRRVPYNTVMINPQDLADMGILSGAPVHVSSETGTVELIAEQDRTLRRGVISIVHGYGGLPEDNQYEEDGVCVNLLVGTDTRLQGINAMPRMTAVPVAVVPAGRGTRVGNRALVSGSCSGIGKGVAL